MRLCCACNIRACWLMVKSGIQGRNGEGPHSDEVAGGKHGHDGKDVLGPSEQAHIRPRIASYAEAVSRYVIGFIPDVTGRTLAVARIVFGSCILYFWLPLTAPNGVWFLAAAPNALSSLAVSGPQLPFLKIFDQSGLLTALSASPDARFLIYWSVAG